MSWFGQEINKTENVLCNALRMTGFHLDDNKSYRQVFVIEREL